MHVLQTIQEYAPVKHSIIFFSSWIGSYSAKKSDPQEDTDDVIGIQAPCGSLNDRHAIGELNDDHIELHGTSNHVEKSDGSDVETEFIGPRSNIVTEPLPCDELQLPRDDVNLRNRWTRYSENSENFERNVLDTSRAPYEEEVYPSLTQNNVEFYSRINNGHSLPDSLRPRPVDISRTLLKEESDVLDSGSDTNLRNKRLSYLRDKGSKFVFRNFKLSVFHKKKKMRKHMKRRGRTIDDYGSPVNISVCDCATGSSGLCYVHAKSQSESEINTGICRLGDDYLADASDISVKSLSLADNDDGSDYVDIDVYRVRNSLFDSSSFSRSERSFELSSDWSEIYFSASDPSLAEECRESDIPDTASDFSQDSRTHVGVRQRKNHRRFKRLPLLGHNVNESFMENECCHCAVM